MSDLIQRCKKYSDPQTREMLNKWEQQIQSNSYGFEGSLDVDPPPSQQMSTQQPKEDIGSVKSSKHVIYSLI